MARRAAATSLTRRLLLTTPPPLFRQVYHPNRCLGVSTPLIGLLSTTTQPRVDPTVNGGGSGKVDRSKPPYNMISHLGDWRLTEQAMKHPGMDYQHWYVRISDPSRIQGAAKWATVGSFAEILRLALPNLGRGECKQKIYKVELNPENVGFGCEVDFDTAYKLKEFSDVEEVSPDYYRNPEYKDYGGELVVDAMIVKRSEHEPKTGQVAL